MSARRRAVKWFERTLLGAVMSGIAFVIERRVLKAIREKEATEPEVRSGELVPER